MTIAKRLEEIRTTHGYRQAFVSEHTGIDQGTLSKIESGARAPTYAQLESIAKLYRMSVIQLLGGDDIGMTVDEQALLMAFRKRDLPCMLRLIVEEIA